jgi:hypothetical protein
VKYLFATTRDETALRRVMAARLYRSTLSPARRHSRQLPAVYRSADSQVPASGRRLANARAVHALEHFGVKVTVNAVALMLLFEQAGGLP